MNLRIVPVRLLDRGFEIIDDQGPGDPTKMPERILQTTKEAVGILVVKSLAVALP